MEVIENISKAAKPLRIDKVEMTGFDRNTTDIFVVDANGDTVFRQKDVDETVLAIVKQHVETVNWVDGIMQAFYMREGITERTKGIHAHTINLPHADGVQLPAEYGDINWNESFPLNTPITIGNPGQK